MKASQIIAEELKKEGLEVVEEVVEHLVNVIADKILPRLAIEADEAPIKAVAGVSIVIMGALKPAILKAVDGIDGKVDPVV